VNETSWTHVWRLCSLYLGTGYDIRRQVKPLREATSPRLVSGVVHLSA
jgi:hypothetical protein